MTDTAVRVLRESTTIAVVGLSRDPGKEAHTVPAAMQAAGFQVIPVNPFADTLLGEPVHRSLADVPVAVDVVDVFRPAPEAAAVAREAARIGAKALWLQEGIVSPEARAIAEEAGMTYVENRCMAVVRAAHDIRPRAV
jgi:predicted CoA-binding protein